MAKERKKHIIPVQLIGCKLESSNPPHHLPNQQPPSQAMNTQPPQHPPTQQRRPNNRQTSKHTHKQTNRHSNKPNQQTHPQTNKHTQQHTIPLHWPKRTQTHKHFINEPTMQPAIHPNKQIYKQQGQWNRQAGKILSVGPPK